MTNKSEQLLRKLIREEISKTTMSSKSLFEKINEGPIDSKVYDTAETRKKCTSIANQALKEIYAHTRQFGSPNSSYASQFMIETLIEILNEQV